MDRLLPILLFLAFVANGVISYAVLPDEVYWHKVLPNTPMPIAIRDLLRSDERTSTSFRVQNVFHPTASYPGYYKYKAKRAALTEYQIHNDPNLSVFFLEKNLHPGAKIRLQLTSATPITPFLPLTTARTVPFSTQRLPEILNRFSIKPGSPEAQVMKDTLEACEAPVVRGEYKHCATSLESMVDFVTSELGTHEVRTLATPVRSSTPTQQYTIASRGMKRVLSTKFVACHPQAYPNAVFYCHKADSFKAYVVPLVGKDGSKIDAVAMCHMDTATWDPSFVGFQVLDVKPGTVPLCHFLSQGHIVWVPAK